MSLKKVLDKASLGGMVGMVRLGTTGKFACEDGDKSLLVFYKGEEKDLFKEEIGVFHLGVLLDILKSMDDPKITYKDGTLTIKEGGKTFEYLTADPEVIYTTYKPGKGEHIDSKLDKVGKAVKIKLTVEQVRDILKGASVLKDASIIFIEGDVIGIGNENENKFRIKLEKGAGIEDKVVLPKKAFQAVLQACEGEVTLALRKDKAPVVVTENDLTFVIKQLE